MLYYSISILIGAAVRTKQRGFIHNLILPSLILMSVAVMGWGYLMNRNQEGIRIAHAVDLARTQLVQIQGVLNWCRVMYPGANNGLAHHKNMPASPVDGSWLQMRAAVCPGAVAAGSLWEAAHDQLAAPSNLVAEWEYRVTAAGVFLRLSVGSAGDPLGRAVLAQFASRIHAAQKTLAGDTLEIKLSS